MKTTIKILIIVCLPANAPIINAETPLDYDGDGKADIGVYRKVLSATPNSFLIRQSSDGSLFGYQFGTANDFPIPIF